MRPFRQRLILVLWVIWVVIFFGLIAAIAIEDHNPMKQFFISISVSGTLAFVLLLLQYLFTGLISPISVLNAWKKD